MRRLLVTLVLLASIIPFANAASIRNSVPQDLTTSATPTFGGLTLTGPILLPNGTAAAPSLTFTAESTLGMYRRGLIDLEFVNSSGKLLRLNGDDIVLPVTHSLAWASGGGAHGTDTPDTRLVRDAANMIAQRNGTAAQVFRLYNTINGANDERLEFDWVTQLNTAMIVTNKSGTGTYRALDIGTRGAASLIFRTSDIVRWVLDPNGMFGPNNDGALNLGASGSSRPGSIFLAAPSITSGTGVTIVNTGEVRRLTHVVTVPYTQLAAAALTADKTIATIPAKTRLCEIVSDTTTPYTGGGVTAATLIVGKSVGGNEYIVSHDVLTAAIRKGEADVDLGTSINRANAVQGCDPVSWTATTNISVRLTTVTANTNALIAGSTTYYITTEKRP